MVSSLNGSLPLFPWMRQSSPARCLVFSYLSGGLGDLVPAAASSVCYLLPCGSSSLCFLSKVVMSWLANKEGRRGLEYVV